MFDIKSIWNLLFYVICFLGCGYQVINVGNVYFSFDTVTRVRFTTPNRLYYPDLHVCFRYLDDAINWTQADAAYNFNFSAILMNNRLDNLTIEDILSFTPEPSEFVYECTYRDVTGYNMKERDRSCPQFDVIKYIMQQYVCYRLFSKEQISVSFQTVQKSLFYERAIYEIRFKGPLSKSGQIRLTISGPKRYPYISRSYAPAYHKMREEDLSIMISCHNYSLVELGYPYNSVRCQEGDEDYYVCSSKCLERKTLKYLDRLPYTNFHGEKSKHKLVSDQMDRNVTITSLYDKWIDECNKECPFFPCSQSFCLTTGHADTSITHPLDASIHGSTIRVESPSNPETRTIYSPTLPLLDFVIYVCSSLGTWFGLVIISCNPMKLVTYIYDNYIFKHMEKRRRMKLRNEILRRRARRRLMMQIRRRV